MKKILLLLLALMSFGHLYADEYIPLLREGVKWVCVETKIGVEEEDYGLRYYTIEVKGDTVVDGVTYKKCYRYSDVNWDEDFVVPCSKTKPFALLREEGRKVYAYNKEPFNGNYSLMDDEYGTVGNDELLYEFEENGRFKFEGYKSFLDQESEIYSIIDDDYSGFGLFVEGVGFDSNMYGDLLSPFYYSAFCTCSYKSYIGLHHMEDADGNIIYKGAAYRDQSADEYIPLLREGVKWVYIETKYGMYGDSGDDYEIPRFYTIEMRGDTVIDGTTYKKCYRYSDVDWSNEDVIFCSNSKPLALLREEGRALYAYNGDNFYFRISQSLAEFPWWYEWSEDGEKDLMLYKFDEDEYFKFEGCIPFLNQNSEVYYYEEYGTERGVFVEGIGFDSDVYGDLLTPFYYGPFCLCIFYSEAGLHHVEDAAGNIIYKGAAYTEPIAGDLDGNGLVDVEDVNAAINIILKLKTIDDYTGNADLDGNGIVDVEDVNILINKILKLE